MTGVTGHDSMVELLDKCKSDDADPADGKEIMNQIRKMADFADTV